ncbi:hypothetical protein EDB81DRAFT_695764 [Dactylonectria macrodidyma]|uniref:PiggyBac transposable element-derived protein domain-containing protein n=1 Tax=Dactylonectria macrodidyma TaxID=307937 RepID=A0A9P9E891_9HYPO|nr:hypothetical protein EDB81DRAFT_695764 [Dactylonectria macrodidyma]
MGAVDVGDQLRASYAWRHRWKRAPWQPLGWGFLLGTVLVNAYKLDSEHGNWRTSRGSHLGWRKALVKQLFERYTPLTSSRKRGRTGVFIDLRNMQLSPQKHRQGKRGKKAACKVCVVADVRSKKKVKVRQPLGELDTNSVSKAPPKTFWGCLDCDVALCKGVLCWNMFHNTNLGVV